MSAFVADNASRIDMSDGFIECVVTMPTLPVVAYEVLASLAEAVADAATTLNGIVS